MEEEMSKAPSKRELQDMVEKMEKAIKMSLELLEDAYPLDVYYTIDELEDAFNNDNGPWITEDGTGLAIIPPLDLGALDHIHRTITFDEIVDEFIFNCPYHEPALREQVASKLEELAKKIRKG